MPQPDRDRKANYANLRVVAVCLVLLAAMGGAAAASVPLYRIFCQVTGYGGTTRVATATGHNAIDRKVTVRFDANVAPGLRWKFFPLKRSVTVKLGENAEAKFIAENLGDKPVTASATFNVTPQQTGSYFNKIQCFCFTETTLKPGEKLEMPVIFFVDPDIVNSEESAGVKTITLSYTFFPAEDQPVAASQLERPSGSTGG